METMRNRAFYKVPCSGLLVLCVLVLLFVSCGGGGNNSGELVGVPGRKGWRMYVPTGMVYVPPGTFIMGEVDENVASTQISFNKQVTISGFYMDQTEITNNEYRQFVETVIRGDGDGLGDYEDGEAVLSPPEGYSVEDFYPDSTVWIRDFAHHLGDPLLTYYFSHPAFDEYPIVSISWEAARFFCKWRTKHLNDYRARRGLVPMPGFRLPNEAEWEYAARGGRKLAKYPWGSPYPTNKLGCFLANFKPGRGNYISDGYSYTAPVGSFFANDFDLYDMSGNVSEWCEDAFSEIAQTLVWDINPLYVDENEPRKVVRGGSWKDISYFLQTGTRTMEDKDRARASIGFRCAMTHLGRSSGEEF